METLLAEKISDSVMTELEKLLITQRNNDSKIHKIEALVFDLKTPNSGLDEKDIQESTKSQIPIVLLNTDPDKMSMLFGIGFESKAVVIHNYENYQVFSPLDNPEVFKEEKGKTITITQSENGESSHTAENDTTEELVVEQPQDLNDAQLARLIEAKISKERMVKINKQVSELKSPPSDLPRGQFKLIYITIDQTITNLVSGQTAQNNSLMEIALIASFNPKAKYMRIRSVGAGFHPTDGGNLKWDHQYDRGYFQNTVSIHMEPRDGKLMTYETSPKNVNGQSSYTEGSSFTVGVDISKNPSFNASYTISESKTTTISDFDIQNDSSGLKGDWDFEMGMTKNSIWDIFEEPFLKKGRVKKLPTLAKKNLQATCEGVWRVNDAPVFNTTIDLLLSWKVRYYNCWVTGNWVKYTKHYKYKGRGVGFYQNNPIKVNFGSVHS